MKSLASELATSLSENGFQTEKRPFSAHVTLIRKARAAGELPPLPEVAWPVRELVLVRSALSAQGSRYGIIGRFPLAA